MIRQLATSSENLYFTAILLFLPTDQRPMDKQSVRSYPGDRDSLRSGRRSRRGEDSSSGYSDNERRYRRSVEWLGY